MRITLTILISSFLSLGTLQAQYGEDWIDYSQNYYKIKIGSEGLYRLNYTALSDAGIPLSSINPKHIQIFHNGIEENIFVSGEADNSFDPGDYIEFYGSFNDGTLDAALYPDPADQPHQYSSLYTDTAAYFLTWTNSVNGKRIQEFYDGNYAGKTADDWIMYRSVSSYKNEHYDGTPYSSPGYFSEYTVGEGWFSSYIQGNVKRNLPVTTELFNPNGPDPVYQFTVYGKSDPTNPGDLDINGFNHEIVVSINNVEIFSRRHRGYTKIVVTDTLDKLLVGASTTVFRFGSELLAKGRHAVSYIYMDYPRQTDLKNLAKFSWTYKGNNSYFQFNNYGTGLTQALIYDLTNNKRIRGDISSNVLKFNTSATGNKKLFILDESKITNITTANLKPVSFTDYNPLGSNFNYLIITHPSLSSSAQEYKNYRESPSGGSYRVLIAYSTELYDQFYYGVHHPMAIRNFCRYFYQNQSPAPEYVLFLGKGQQYNNITYNTLKREYEDLVPTWGLPPSDYMFVTDYSPDDLRPAMAVGRIPARQNNEVLNYLNKLKLHEQGINTSKIMLQLTGGATGAEASGLQGHQNGFYNIAKGEKLGMQRIQYSKDQSVLISTSLVDEIQDVINNGVHTLSYFGHGASQVLEVDIGDPSKLDNKGNYPLFVFLGCALGNSYGEASLPEQFLLQEDIGAVAWIASSAFGFINELSKWSYYFYANLYDDNYGQSIGKVIQQTIGEFQQPFNNFNRAQCRQMLYHGDPAVKLYAPELPDYETLLPVAVYPSDVNAENDSFALVLDVTNYGIALDSDTPNLHIRVQYANDSIRTFGPRQYRPVYSTESIYFWLPINPFSVGVMKFTISVDSGDYIEEMSPYGEFNNVKTFEFFMPSNSIFPLNPPKDAIVGKPEVILEVQNYNVLSGSNEFIFELDTTPLFNSPLKQTSGIVTGTNIISHKFLLPPIDSTDYFWRARFNKPISAGGTWENSTFAFIYNSEEGWSQDYYSKLLESTNDFMTVDTSTRELIFSKTISEKYGLYASGKNRDVTTRGIRVEPNYYYPGFLYNGLGAIAVDPNTQERYMDSSKFNKYVPSNNWGYSGKYYWPNSRSGAYWFDMRNQEDRDSFVAYLNNIPDEYFIFLFASGNTANELWPDTIYKSFELFGATEIRNIDNGHPYALMGKKGWTIGQATELIANYGSIFPPEDQFVEFATPIYPLSDKGSLTSQKIGPAKSWTLFYRTIEPFDSESDSLSYDIIGVELDGSETTLVDNNNSFSKDLTFIDAEQFPFLKIKGNFYDPGNYSPVQQKRWTVLYEGVPEGSLQPDISFSLNKDTLQEGDSLKVKIAFENISDMSMDSVLVFAYNQDYFGKVDTLDYSYYPPIDSGEHFIMEYSFSTYGHPNNNRLNISVNHNMDQLEQTLKNNIVSIKYHVERDERNPLLDVVFDGVHILDKDIVSPSPLITMTVLDENKFIFISDPTSFTVKLSHPDGTISDITHNLDEVTFYPASGPGEKAIMEYHPKDLPSGIYKLSVEVKDASGNESSDLEYQINFEVIRDATITNFYPYPNPFTSSMKFVYTLTGEQIPDYLKIQIMTITGKVVREITQAELGTMRIGNNISEFTWDGTDEFGDPLANGVYLFKVTARLNGEDLKHRSTSGDIFFQDGYGKIYLMR